MTVHNAARCTYVAMARLAIVAPSEEHIASKLADLGVTSLHLSSDVQDTWTPKHRGRNGTSSHTMYSIMCIMCICRQRALVVLLSNWVMPRPAQVSLALASRPYLHNCHKWPYLHNCHKWVRVGWIESVALSSPLRLIVPVDSTPDLHKGKICTLLYQPF